MSKENKSDKFYELFPEVCDVIDKARRKYYLDVSDADRKIIKDFYNHIMNLDASSEEEKIKKQELLFLFVERLNKTDDLSFPTTDFKVGEHLKTLNGKLGNLGQSYIQAYINSPQDVALNTRNLFRTDEFLSHKDPQYEVCKKQVDQLLNKFTKGNSKLSTELKRLLKEYDLEIKITSEEGCNGSLDFFSQKKKAVLSLDKGLFSQDESIQAFMLAHELGHFIDYANRPKGTEQHLHQVTEECFADISAAEFVKSAGLDLSKVINLFDKMENDPRHPRKEDRIAAIGSVDASLTYQEQMNRAYYLIKKTQSLVSYKAQKNDLNENLNVLQNGEDVSKESIYSSLKTEQKNMDEDDMTTAEYIAQRTSDVSYRRFAQKYFIDDETFKRGYCTSLPLLALKSSNPQLASLIPNMADPKEFIKEIKQKFPDCIYSSSENRSLSDVLKNENISSNAFVIFDLKKENGNPQEDSSSFHTMIFKGLNEKGNCLCDGFDAEQNGYVLNQHRQCGYVIDTFKLFYNILKKKDNCHALTAHLAKKLAKQK